jgi:hypothetical protein
MSRRPQEPPRSVSRHHRMTFLKTSGIVARICQQKRLVNIFLYAGLFAVNSITYVHPQLHDAAPCTTLKRVREKRFANSHRPQQHAQGSAARWAVCSYEVDDRFRRQGWEHVIRQ